MPAYCWRATLGIGGGTLGDLFTAKERGKAVAVYSVAVLAGPILGPLLGGVVSQHLGWRWVFFMASIIDVVVQLLGLVFLSETFAPVLLRRRQRRRDGESGRPPRPKPDPLRYVSARLRQNLGRAVILLGTQPIVQVLALYSAFLYGIVYSLYATFSELLDGALRPVRDGRGTTLPLARCRCYLRGRGVHAHYGPYLRRAEPAER